MLYVVYGFIFAALISVISDAPRGLVGLMILGALITYILYNEGKK